MPKGIRLEKVTGVVAMSYLALIPAGAFLVWQKLRAIDADVSEIWLHLDMPSTVPASMADRLKWLLKR